MFNGAAGGNDGAAFFLANDEPYSRGETAIINKSLKIGNVSKSATDDFKIGH
jgi:hypothetical protein